MVTPEQRARKNLRLREWRKRKSLDPDWRKRQSAYSSAYAARRREESASFREKRRIVALRYYQKLKADPTAAEQLKARSRAKYHKGKRDPVRHRKRLDRYNAWAEQRKRVDPNFALRRHLRARLSDLVRRARAIKRSSALALVGCSLAELKRHLESQFARGMTWANYGRVWHIDHIIPCAKFDLTDERQQRLCFHYLNLRPLLAQENLRKQDKLTSPAQLSLLLPAS